MTYTFGQGRKSFQSILDDYNRRIQVVGTETLKGWHAILDFYGNLPDWATAVEEAGRFHFDASGKSRTFQDRIPLIAKRQFAEDLQKNQTVIYNSANFEELYDNIEKSCKKKGIGELIIYDTAMRLGAFLEKLRGGCFKPYDVFLHNGAMKGAMILFERGLLARPGNRMPLSAFAELFPQKEAWEVEEILCIYKDNF